MNVYFVLGCLVLAGGMVFVYMMSLSRKSSPKTGPESELNQDKTTQPPNRICTSLACDWVGLVDDTLEGEVQKKRIIIMKCNECGAMDKTIESVDLQSKKTWKTIKEKSLPSAYEQMDSYQRMALAKVPEWMFRKTYILVQQCVETGEIRETIADNKLQDK